MYRAVTRKIEVTVTPRFLSERSSPNNGYYFWSYTIDIANRGSATVQRKTRHWRITDALGRLQEVKGPGSWQTADACRRNFEYSGCRCRRRPAMILYVMVSMSGEHFGIEIPASPTPAATTIN